MEVLSFPFEATSMDGFRLLVYHEIVLRKLCKILKIYIVVDLAHSFYSCCLMIERWDQHSVRVNICYNFLRMQQCSNVLINIENRIYIKL